MPVMTKLGATPRNSSTRSSTIDSALDRSSMTAQMCGYSKSRCRNGKRTESFSPPAPQPSAFRNNTPSLMKPILSLVTLIVSASLLSAQVVVIDPTAIARSEANHVVDLAKYVQMVNNQVTQINTLTQQLQQIQAYVKAFGNPEQLLNIVGANQLVGSLQQSGIGQTIGQLQRTANGIEALRYTGNGLYTSLGQTFTTPGGVQVPRLDQLYRKYGAIQQDSRNFQSVSDDVLRRRQTLRNN